MTAPDYEQSCAFLIHDTTRLIRRRFEFSIRDLGLTTAKWRVLASLRRRPGLTQSELADRLDIEKAPLGLALDWLQQADWIKREADANDRRMRRVYLAEKAEPILALMEQRFRGVEANYLRGFDAEETARMLQSLQIINQELGCVAETDGQTRAMHPETYLSVLFECARLLERRFAARLAEIGFTRNQWLVLNTVFRREGMRQTEVAEATELGVAPLGKMIDALEKGGWVERRSDPGDRRANQLFVTRRARHMFNSMHVRFENLHEALVRPLGSARKQHLVSSLGWIRHRLQEETAHAMELKRAGVK